MECCGGDWKAADAGSPYVGLLPARQPQLVGRDGVVQIERRGPWGSWKQVGDLFTTLLELRWRWHFLFFVSSFLASWLFFASLWYLVLYLHGDLDHIGDPKWVPCITNVNGFYSVFLFSVESQHTIGYGYRYPHEECPEGFIVLCLQAIMGVLIQCITVSVLYAKFTRPQRRSHSIKFSKNCVICLRDNKICLLFRVANLQKSKLIGVQVSAYLLQTRYTAEGEEIPLCQTPLDIKTDEKPLVWPLTASHEIGPRSPLYELSMQQLRISQFELLVMLEATDAASGHSFQALTSYMPDQLLWGRRFTKMISYNEGRIYSDIGLFNDTYAVSMPHCSARELERKTNLESREDDWSTSRADFVRLLPPHPPKIVDQNGVVQIHRKGAWGKRRKIRDFFSIMLELRWRWHLLIFLLAYLGSWLGFAMLWYLVLHFHGDLGHLDDPSWNHCIINVNSFYSVLLFSAETQHTIGYGYRYPSDKCPEGFIILFLQSILGVLIQCITVSVLYAKMTRPQGRAHSIEFSKRCVICLRDGKLCLLFRMANLQKSKLIGVQVNAHLLKTRYTEEGEEIPFYQRPLILKTDEKPRVCPLTACHEIGPSSPLYDLSRQHLRDMYFEVLVILTATDSASGHSFEALASYLPENILWGYRFCKMISIDKDKIYADMKYFNEVYRVATPKCSAMELEDRQRKLAKINVDKVNQDKIHKYCINLS
ncbi:irk-2 [Cordylochernes scorpioides]|uniref:Irk-2 n=1 Tax=Cordylochernes scorpioides TaxID=51811 RepID=A0ABY6L8C5_9ARAC|nr:irk-2 [Cordylochernes scorpioides]